MKRLRSQLSHLVPNADAKAGFCKYTEGKKIERKEKKKEANTRIVSLFTIILSGTSEVVTLR